MRLIFPLLVLLVALTPSYLASRNPEPAAPPRTLSRVTVYNPVSAQCDDDPLVTADCSRIDLDELKSGELRWVALSRDLLEEFPYGSLIEIFIEEGHPKNGLYEVHDTMHKRFKNTMDILTYKEKVGKWTDVQIRLVD